MADGETSGGRGTRERKTVEQFTIQEKEKAEFVITAGAGTKFGDIENIKLRIEKHNASSEELKTLHRVCYNRAGSKAEVKKNLREFSGLTIDGVELERKIAAISKLDSKVIKSLLTFCDLSTSGTKAQNVESLVAFLKEPAESGKKSIAVKSGEKRARSEKKKVCAGACQPPYPTTLAYAKAWARRAIRRRRLQRRARARRPQRTRTLSRGHSLRTSSTATAAATRSRRKTLRPGRRMCAVRRTPGPSAALSSRPAHVCLSVQPPEHPQPPQHPLVA